MSEDLSELAPELARGGEKISAKILRETRAAKKVSARSELQKYSSHER